MRCRLSLAGWGLPCSCGCGEGAHTGHAQTVGRMQNQTWGREPPRRSTRPSYMVIGAPASQPWLGEEPRSQTGRQVGLRAWVAVVRASPTQSRRLAVVPASSGGTEALQGSHAAGRAQRGAERCFAPTQPEQRDRTAPPSPRDSCTRLPTSPRNRVPGSRGVPRPQLLAWAAPPEGAPAVTARCVPISESPSPQVPDEKPHGHPGSACGVLGRNRDPESRTALFGRVPV